MTCDSRKPTPKAPMKPTSMPEAKWPPRTLVGHVAHATCADRPFAVWKKEGLIPRMPHSEYLSLEEHTHLLAEAVAKAKAQTIESLRGNLEERFTDEEIEAMKQFVMQSELRKGATPENGGKNG